MKKIMFNDKYGLTRAVLEGCKTMTRRIIPARLINEFGHNKYNDRSNDLIRKSAYQVGDVIAIAQRLVDVFYECKLERDVYHNDNGWNNKMFVKAKDMPHHIKITDVCLERLQDISDNDCLSEGVYEDEIGDFYVYCYDDCRRQMVFATPRKAFASLIDKVSGKGIWESNPWVFVYEFELID